jgi:hypothetical protein
MPSISVNTQGTRPRRRGLLFAAAGLAVVTVGLAVVAVADTRSERAFAAAPICPAADANTTCRQLVPATVTDITIQGGRYSSYKMSLAGPGPVAGSHSFPDDGGVLDFSDVGDHIVAEVWRGHVVAVRDDVFRTFTSEAPVYGERKWSTGALAGGLLALVIFLCWVWNIRSVGRGSLVTSARGWRGIAYFLAWTAALSAVFAAAIELAVPDSPALIVIGGIFVVLVSICALFYWRGIRRLRRAIALPILGQ